MSSASRAGEEGAPPDVPDDADRRSLGDPAKEEREHRRFWVNRAFDELHLPTVDDATRPPHLNTGRKRLDWMINHRTLNPEDVIDRGVSVDRSFQRFALRREFLELVDSVISYTQKVLGNLAPAAAADPHESGEYWEFDPQGVLRGNLAGTSSLPDLNFAWTMFNQRCAAALAKYRKYRARAESLIAGETPPSLSPITTPGSVYRDLPQMGSQEEKLKYLWGSVPSYALNARDSQATWDRARFLSKAPEELVRPPSPLVKAFPPRLPERDPLTKYYDGDQARDRAFGKEFTPWSGSLPVRDYEEKWNPPPDAKKEKGLKFQKQSDDDPSANLQSSKAKRKESGSKGGRERDASTSREAVSFYGSLSTRRLDLQESASRAGGSKKKRSRSRRSHKKRESEGDGGGKDDRKSAAGPPRRPSGGDKDPAPHAAEEPGDDPSDGDGDEEDDEEDSSSDEEGRVVDLDEGEELPFLPYGTTAPTVLASIKPDQLPSWDGNKSTAHEYLAAVYEYANSGGYMNQAVGYWLWTRLEKGSAVFQWYVTLSPTLKSYMRRSAHNFLGVVQRDYLGPKWIRNLATEFQFQSFREYKHRHESPSQFIYRRIIASRALAFAPKNSREEVKMILSVAPPSWGIVLVPSSIDSTDTLTKRVLQFEEELANASRSGGGDIKAQVASALKELGVSTSAATRSKFPSRRPEGVSAFSVEASAESGGPEEREAPSEEAIANEMLAVAYSVVASREKSKPPSKPRFARRDDVKSKKKPPAPCRPCGSPFHWNRDCPHWNEYLAERRAEGHLVEAEDSDAERAYNVAYYLCGQDFEQAARAPTEEGDVYERKTSHAEGKPALYEVRAQSFVSRIEEIEDDYAQVDFKSGHVIWTYRPLWSRLACSRRPAAAQPAAPLHVPSLFEPSHVESAASRQVGRYDRQVRCARRSHMRWLLRFLISVTNHSAFLPFLHSPVPGAYF
ncbi:uncharacterized protein SCHCODRAFT_02579912 [Schizophyllum commune H4-8]|nr:uncharacterized protein SCHCODRAFT_02579912 [Schizophyllum commune H4-8]KAI5892951.1 hypothetical protein SCHCODRAFT_02579912 [Schizophyllum commune H4-8]